MSFLVTGGLDVLLNQSSHSPECPRNTHGDGIYLVIAFACEFFQSGCELRMTCRYEGVARRGCSSEAELHSSLISN
jgi:hypothetical protein